MDVTNAQQAAQLDAQKSRAFTRELVGGPVIYSWTHSEFLERIHSPYFLLGGIQYEKVIVSDNGYCHGGSARRFRPNGHGHSQ
ncbi:MAG TPA: hypothetical protein VES89_04085 [Candidatus Competibacteraceae bacterium]|nr:hypothetical protein [Candidatus Competibacteraceae bacterium]